MALQHLRSSTANKRPLATALVSGQLAVNTEATSPGLFFKDASGGLVKVGPCHVGATAPNASPASGGETGNTLGEQWLDTSGTNPILKIWNGSTWVSDAAEFVNASGDTMTGALVMDNQQQVRFRETTANGTNYIAIQAPASVASDKTLTLPDATGTLVSTGDTGSVTSTMIANGTIVNDDVNASAAIAGTKISPDFGAQNVTTTGTSTAASFIPTSSTAPANGMYLSAANTLAFNTNSAASPRAVIDSSGRLGINTTDPSAAGATAYRDLVIAGTGNRGITVQCGSGNVGGLVFNTSNGGNSGGYIYDASASQMLISAGGGSGNIAFSAGGSQRAAIDSSGRLLLSATSTADLNAAFQVRNDAGPVGQFFRSSADANGPGLTLTKSRGTAASPTEVSSGDELGVIRFRGYDGATWQTAAQIQGIASASWTDAGDTTDNPGAIAFSVTADGASTPAEMMRLTSTGLAIGSTAVTTKLGVHDSSVSQIRLSSDTLNYGELIFSSLGYGYDAYGASIEGGGQGGRDTGFLAFKTGFGVTRTERCRLTSFGQWLWGTSTARANFYNAVATTQLQLEGTNYQNSSQSLICNNAATAEAAILTFAKSAGSATGSNTAVAINHKLGEIIFQGNDGAEFVAAAQITAEVDGARGANDMPGRIVLSTTASGASSPTERLRITSTGQVRLTGAGITFNGDTATANELDDYEEGTFTPTIVGGSTAGTASYTTQIGRYTKIGNRVFFQIFLDYASFNGTGEARVSLPSTYVSNTTSNNFQTVSIRPNNYTLTASNVMTGIISPNTAYIRLEQYPVGGGAVANAPVDAAATLVISGVYEA